MDVKRVVWVGSSKEDLSAASAEVKVGMGFALYSAQRGNLALNAKPMRGELRDVTEVVERDASGTFRLMYTTVVEDVVYVLDFFQKKSTSGIATAKVDTDRILSRLKKVRERHAKR